MDRLEAMELAAESDHCLRPAKAFSLLGNEIRVRILEALWQASEEVVAFSTLCERVAADNSPQFNYHLGELTGHFVRKTAEGYELRKAGERVVQAVVEGSFNAHPAVDPIDTSDVCVDCGEPLHAKYTDEQFAIECTSCGRTHGEYGFPPGGLIGRDDAEILSAFNHRVRHLHSLARNGVCPECSGQMTTEIVTGTECCFDADPRVEFACLQCQRTMCSTVGLVVLDQSPVVGFYRDHGIDLQKTPYWRLDWCVSNELTTVVATEPARIAVEITEKADSLTVTLNDQLSIVSTNRAEGRIKGHSGAGI